jgi:uncharacterized LabA/DUF88 family protein
MKACVFVDGENFRHTIVDLFKAEFHEHDYLPEHAKWVELFNWLVSQAHADVQRIRTYWYVIETLDCFPYNLPNPETVTMHLDKMNLLKRIVSFHEPYQKELDTLNEPEKTQRMIEMLKELCKRQNEMGKRFDGWIKIQDGITLRHRGIEFRRAGAIKYNLFEKKLGNEKAVDVKLASDLITLKDIYDVAVIVSGDQDYVPAVKVVKDAGKQVVNVAFLTRNGELLPGGARRLNLITDWHYDVPFKNFADYLQI